MITTFLLRLGTENERAKNRAKSFKTAIVMRKKLFYNKARNAFANAVDVSPVMALQVIKLLKLLKIE